ncbi:MAG: hypothetical protein JKY02_07190 [Flavobacteriaceae bacterium]|nr:hypothetical protein [Flavobacteriaceae bacterium]
MAKNRFEITCDEATTICDKNQYGEASFFDKVKLQFHLLRCAICSLYSKQNVRLTKEYNKKATSAKVISATLCMSDKEKEELRKEFKELSIDK